MKAVKVGVVMEYVKKINNKSLHDFKSSLTLQCIFGEITKNFYDMDENQKKEMLIKLDEDISAKFEIPTANFIYENNEHVLDTENIYFGKINSLKSSIDLISRYLFEKRQQYQRICVKNDDSSSFDEEDFEYIKKSFKLSPLSKKYPYIPLSDGFKDYLLNPNKLDALLFMTDQLNVVMKMLPTNGLYDEMTSKDINKMMLSVEKNGEFIEMFQNSLQEMLDTGVFAIRYKIYDRYIGEINRREKEQIIKVLNTANSGKFDMFLCFHENIWECLQEEEKKRVLYSANKLIAAFFGINREKPLEFSKGMNSYHFVRNDKIHIKDINNSSARNALCTLIWDYSYEGIYQNIFRMKESEKEKMLKEYEECKKIIHNSKGDYSKIREYSFVKKANKLSVKFQKIIYFYMNNGLYIDGELIRQPMSKDEFVIDMFKNNKRR